jgi:hypothetical protein
MTLHHHPHSSAQKWIWSSNEEPLKFSLKHASLQAPLWHGNLRRASLVSTVVAITRLLIGGNIITIIIMHPLESFIGVCGGGG